jgi:type IV pilus assembly protein PilV
MKTLKRTPHPVHQDGIVLLEGLIAIVIFSIGILGIIGLQGAMITSAAEGRARAEASYIAQKRISQLWADPNNLANYVVAAPGTDISQTSGLPKGRLITERATASASDNTGCTGDLNCMVVTVTWRQPSSNDQHSYQLIARITP